MKGRKLNSLERKTRLNEDAAERRKVFKELLGHIRSGKSLDCFPPLSEKTIKEYLKIHPLEFIEEELEEAFRAGKDNWEELGRRQANGTCLGNSRTWYYNMTNRYGWRERVEAEVDHKGSVSVSIVSYATSKAQGASAEVSES